MDLQVQASIMKMSRRVADIESSSNGEVALLEELEDEKFNFGMSSSCNLCIFTCLCLTAILFLLLWDQVPKSCLCLIVVLILDATLWTSGSSMASMATDCRGGMYCLMSCMLSSDPLCFLSHLAWPPTDSWVQVSSPSTLQVLLALSGLFVQASPFPKSLILLWIMEARSVPQIFITLILQVYIVWFSESGLHLLPDHIETRVEITIVPPPLLPPSTS